MPEAFTALSGEYLVAQGLLGIATGVLASVVAYLYRHSNAQRKQFDEDIVEERTRHNAEVLAERARHATEIAAERKLNADLQEERFKELRSTLRTVEAVTTTVDAALAVLGRRD